MAEKAEKEFRQTGQATVLFMDEIHRFNKKQQDIFLPYIESGVLVLIGATTENPSFSINSVSAMWEHHSQALLSLLSCGVAERAGQGGDCARAKARHGSRSLSAGESGGYQQGG